MAALNATELQDAIIQVGSDKYFNQFEGRMSTYGALQAFLDGADEILPKSVVDAAKKSPSQPSKVPVLTKYNANILTARSCEIVCNDRVSAFKALTYATKGFTICVTDAINAGNYISAVDDFAWQMKNGLRTVIDSLDTASVAALETNRSLVLASSSLGTITNAAGDYEENDLNDLYYDIPALMDLNDLGGGRLANVMNSEAVKTMMKYESQGQNNSVNLAGILNGTIPSAGDYMHYKTNNITLGTNREVHYVFPEGAVGLFTWNPYDFVNRSITGDGKKFYTMQDPIFGITWGVLEETTCMDMSATYPGQTAVVGTKYSFTADFSWLTAYSSDTSSPIVKIIARRTPVSS